MHMDGIHMDGIHMDGIHIQFDWLCFVLLLFCFFFLSSRDKAQLSVKLFYVCNKYLPR